MNNLKLRGKRVESGLTQEELARKIGISPVSYSRKESGKRDFSCTEISNLARELKLSDKEIIKIFLSSNLPIG